MSTMGVGNRFLSLPSKGSKNAATTRLNLLQTDGKLDGLVTKTANGMSPEVGSGTAVTLVLEAAAVPKLDLQL